MAVYVLYSLLLALALAVLFPAYALKLRFGRGEALHLAERLGFRLPARPAADRPLLWIHAVSVGEVLSLPSLVSAIKAAHPDWLVAVSVLTDSGFRVAKERLAMADGLFFIPLDFRFSVRRVMRRLAPDCLVLAESEFWPRLLREAGRRAVPVLLINGRISTKTAARMKKLKPLVRRAFAPVNRFLVQTERDRTRLLEAGLPAGRIEVAGNLKCEVRLPAMFPENIASARTELGLPAGEALVVAGSIHPGEEKLLLPALQQARRDGVPVRLVLAPRHPEKFAGLEKDWPAEDLVFMRRSRFRPGEPWNVLILDTIGELARSYALADAAFVGGSLVPWGGQNLLEPAFYGKPVYFGPHMDNFAALAEAFVLDGGARIVRTADDLKAMFVSAGSAEAKNAGERARSVLASLSGATERTLAAVEREMSHGRDAA
ncbi:MAG: glycosyltransferase N-terminal domain-containing protein [Acidobacteriota bacterium]|nr:glycosyltransferase N-terminal domain-containing protein [Acidobacteriota bacterium]